MASKLQYLFTATAESDLDEILNYIAVDLCNATAAQNFAKKVFEQIDNICAFPQSGALVSNEYIADKSIRKILIDNYILYYKFSDTTLYIVRIIYGQRNLDEILQLL